MSDQPQVSPDNLQYNVTVTDELGNQIYSGGYASVDLQHRPPQITVWNGAFLREKSFTRGSTYVLQGNPSLGCSGTYRQSPAKDTYAFTVQA